jgi:hypothetical protein
MYARRLYVKLLFARTDEKAPRFPVEEGKPLRKHTGEDFHIN